MVAQQQERFRPYASRSNVIGVLNRVRSRNVPELVNNDLLRIAGMPEAVFGRVTQALRFLNLIHEDGRPTDILDAISGAPDAQYRELLANAIRQAYREDFERIDPGEDTQGQIIDAFRPYQPRSQTARMVMLFLGLCREAGIPVKDAPRERRMNQPAARRSRITPRRTHEVAPLTDQTQQVTSTPDSPALLFGITEQDIGELDDTEFSEVWGALGMVARARARARKRETQRSEEDIEVNEEQ